MANGNDLALKLIAAERISIANMRSEINKIIDQKLLALDELELRTMKVERAEPTLKVVDESVIEAEDIIASRRAEREAGVTKEPDPIVIDKEETTGKQKRGSKSTAE